MKVGYTNGGVKEYLDTQERERGSIWYIVASFTDKEWQDIVHNVGRNIDKFLGNTEGESTKKILRINGILSNVIDAGEDQGYKDVDRKNIRDFINVCGKNIHPTMSLQKLPKDKVAVIFTLARKTVKESMSPRRQFDT